MLKINIGEVNLDQAIKEFIEQKEDLVKQFTTLNTKGENLERTCAEYEEYASDKEEREVVTNT